MKNPLQPCMQQEGMLQPVQELSSSWHPQRFGPVLEAYMRSVAPEQVACPSGARFQLRLPAWRL
jgi:hypothetical protein